MLPSLEGRVLDFGCGMGNLAVAAAQKGCNVTALDASPIAIGDLANRTRKLGLCIDARVAELRDYDVPDGYDCIVSIGLLMFFPQKYAQLGLERVRRAISPGGLAAINVLIEGPTFMDMFDPSGYYLFAENELQDAFFDWVVEYRQVDSFSAPANTVKRFCTIAARRPWS